MKLCKSFHIISLIKLRKSFLYLWTVTYNDHAVHLNTTHDIPGVRKSIPLKNFANFSITIETYNVYS